jgi:hypothetical protein
MMISFDQTVTLYNKRYDPVTKKNVWPKVVIRDASWAGSQRVATSEGLMSNDGYSVRVQRESMPDGFVERSEYVALSDHEGFWTAQNGDVVVLGEGPEVIDLISEVTKLFTDSFVVTTVNTASLKRILPHLHLRGV